MEQNLNTGKDIFLSIKDLQKIYSNGEQAVYNFNLDIEKNEFIVIVGPSGCGKSTTLRMIAGLEDVTSGTIYSNGELLNYKPSKDRKIAIVFQSYALYPQMTVYDNIAFPLAMNKFSFSVVNTTILACRNILDLFREHSASALLAAYDEAAVDRGQEFTPWERLAFRLRVDEHTAKAFVKFVRQSRQSVPDGNEKQIVARMTDSCRKAIDTEQGILAEQGMSVNDASEVLDSDGRVMTEHRKMTPFEIKKKVYDTAGILDLSSYLDKYPRELSGGQMQRVALGRAIVKNVPLFLMDEPLSNLDAKLRLTMRSEIVKIHNRIGATTIYVTHDQTEAMTMASRIVVMSRGFVQQIGTPEEIYDDPCNLFVVKFIGSPSVNVLPVTYEGSNRLRIAGGSELQMQGDLKAIHDGFYRKLLASLEAMNADFDKTAAEAILKIQSALSMHAQKRTEEKNRSLFRAIRKLFAKKTEAEPYRAEKTVCRQKTEEVRHALVGEHELIACIRPEKIQLRKYVPGETLAPSETKVVATVCELLGAEYYVHVDFGDRDVVCRYPTGSKIKAGDTFVLSFDSASVLLFDPITGERIQ